MSYNIYKNKKILKELIDKNYRLLQFNHKLNNPFHIYLLLSVIPDEINNKSVKELDILGEIFKKNLNKFVKKKFNKNYINSNSQNSLDIFTDLFHYNISIFNKNFDNLDLSTENKRYTKRLYFLNRDDDFFLLIKKNKNEFKLKFGNKVLKSIQSGGGVRKEREGNPNSNLSPKEARRKLDPVPNYESELFFNSKYYSNTNIYNFLEKYSKKLIDPEKNTDGKSNNKQRLSDLKEITIAVFTDYMRGEIFSSIKNIENKINTNENMNVVIVISGGSGFNNLISKENRPISPDIDVKLCLHTESAIKLHRLMTGFKNVDTSDLKIKVARELLLVRTYLFVAMKEEAKRLNEIIFPNKVEELNQMFIALHKHCNEKFNSSDEKGIPFLSNIGIDNKNKFFEKKFRGTQTKKIVVRETLMSRGIDGKLNDKNETDKPYKLHDVFLYALDLLYDGNSGFTSLAGILDIVVAIPGHIGYILPEFAVMKTIKDLDLRKCYNITQGYFKEESLKLINYGLRTKNKKILKDLERFGIIGFEPVLKTLKNIITALKGSNSATQRNANKLVMSISNPQNSNSSTNSNTNSNTMPMKFGERVNNMPTEFGEFINNMPTEFGERTNNTMPMEFGTSYDVAHKVFVYMEDIYDTQESQETEMFNKLECISESSLEPDEYEKKYEEFNQNLENYEYSNGNDTGKMNYLRNECTSMEANSVNGGNSNNDIDLISIMSISKLLQLMVNNNSILNSDNFETDNNLTYLKQKYQDINENNIHKVNFEKLTEFEHNENININTNYFLDEYISTKSIKRMKPFILNSVKNIQNIEKICQNLLDLLDTNKNNIHKLCYGYETDTYNPSKSSFTCQEYAKFLLTYCKGLDLQNISKNKTMTKYFGNKNVSLSSIQKLYSKISELAN